MNTLNFAVQLEQAVADIQKATGCSDADVGGLLLGIGVATLEQAGITRDELRAAFENLLAVPREPTS